MFDVCWWWAGAVFGVLGWAALGRAARRAGCWLHCGGGLYKLLPALENMWSLSSLMTFVLVSQFPKRSRGLLRVCTSQSLFEALLCTSGAGGAVGAGAESLFPT